MSGREVGSPIDVLPLLEVLVLRVRVGHVVVLVLPALPAAQVAGREADEEGRQGARHDGHHQRLHRVLGRRRVGRRYFWA